jgi:hypothetical protein
VTAAPETPALKRVLRPVHLWAIAVGLVISGDYFGWNYGLAHGGPVGMGVATLAVTVLYVCFIFSYTELSTAIPHAGGPFAFAQRAFGPWGAYLAGAATLMEFLFAPPAIARAIGSYVHFRVPALPVDAVALGAFALFGLVNALGVAVAATFELVVTVLATFELSRTRVALYGTTAVPTAVAGAGAATVAVADDSAEGVGTGCLREEGGGASVQGGALLGGGHTAARACCSSYRRHAAGREMALRPSGER